AAARFNGALLPAKINFTPNDLGSYTFTVTLPTPGLWTLTVADQANGSVNVTTVPISVIGLAKVLAVTAPTSTAVRASFAIAVTPVVPPTFAPPILSNVGADPTGRPAVGDFNLDGKLDVVVPHYGKNTLTVALGNGDGTFKAPVTYGTARAPSVVVVTDVNGD